jgi:hypothetical protein
MDTRCPSTWPNAPGGLKIAATPRTHAFWLMANVAGSNGSHEGMFPLFSPLYMIQAVCNCFKLFMHATFCAFDLAEESAGSSIAARIAMMVMTTSSSINEKARCFFIKSIRTINHSQPCIES